VERADFFRYLAILADGGVYADVDTECLVAMDSLIAPEDSLIVGWENEFESYTRARARTYARNPQLVQWVFAGDARHPCRCTAAGHQCHASGAWAT
jgi:inositol phosphorylceramide mannosyltransferase catalytic subunit